MELEQEKKLVAKFKYDYIKLCLGYPKEDDFEKMIWRKWNGVKTGKFLTDLFGYIHCFAIDVDNLIYSDQFAAPQTFFKKVLTLNLKLKYWEQIRDRKKPLEFREIKPYWIKRLTLKDREVENE